MLLSVHNVRHASGTAHLMLEAVFTENSNTLAAVLQDEEGKRVIRRVEVEEMHVACSTSRLKSIGLNVVTWLTSVNRFERRMPI